MSGYNLCELLKRIFLVAISVSITLPVIAETILPIEDGNNWTYNISTGGTDTYTVLAGTFTVNGVQVKRIRNLAGDDALYYGLNFYGNYDEDFVPGVSDFLLALSPPIQILSQNSSDFGITFPLSGTMIISGTGFATETLTYTGSRLVVGYETITVPAGTFEALKVIVNLNATGTLGGQPFSSTEQLTNWYAPDIGIIKGIDTTDGTTVVEELTAAFVDSDGDGVNVFTDNCRHVANASQLDTDGDGVGNACDDDDDNDNLSDILEEAIGTNPLVADSDGDGLNDGIEVGYDGDNTTYTPGQDLNPLSTDTDGDGFSDAVEVSVGTNPLDIADYPVQADGDLNGDNVVNAADVIIVRRILFGDIIPTANEFEHADVAPLVGGVPAPDGQITTGDLLVIQQKALGLINF